MKPIYRYLILCAAVFLLYGKTATYDFTNFDDDLIISENAEYFKNEAKFLDFFTKDAFLDEETKTSFYRPLQNLMFWFEIKLAGDTKPYVFHFVNVLLFALLVCAIFNLFLLLKIPEKLSFLGALLFLAHPLFTLSVAWIPARGDLLIALFAVLSTNFFIRFINSLITKDLLLTILFFALALFSKETAVMLPFIFLLYFYLMQPQHKIKKQHFVLGVSMFVVGVCWFLLRSQATAIDSQGTHIQGFFAGFRTLPTAIGQFFIPFEQAPMPVFTTTKIVLGIVNIFLLFFIFVKNKSMTWKNATFYVMWCLLFLLPTFLFTSAHFPYLDHRFLLPLIGVLGFVLYWISTFWKNNQKIIQATFITLIIIFSIITFGRTSAYENSEVFYTTVIKHNKQSAVAYYNMAKILEKKEKYKEAISNYTRAINLNSFYQYYADRGLLLGKMGDLQNAIKDFDQTIALNKNYDAIDAIYVNRGFAKFKLKLYEESIVDYKNVLALQKPTEESKTNALLGLSFSYYQLNELDKASYYVQEVLMTDPNHPGALKQIQLINSAL